MNNKTHETYINLEALLTPETYKILSKYGIATFHWKYYLHIKTMTIK